MQDLNDHCLQEIFGLDNLDLLDLCSLAETCKHFDNITQTVSPKVLSFQRNGGNGITVHFQKYLSKIYKPADVSRIFKNFGTRLTEISIDNGYEKESCTFLIDLIARHSEDTLKYLSIRLHDTPISSVVSLKPIFKKLELLHLEHSSYKYELTHDSSLFAGMDSLVELRVFWLEGCDTILESTFPKLTRFEYAKETYLPCLTNPVAERVTNMLTNFISRHIALEKLTVRFDCDSKCLTNILQSISNSCKNLVDLTLSCGLMNADIYLHPLNQLKSLVTLRLRDVLFNDFELFAKMTKLRDLCLLYCTLPHNENQFVSLSRLIKLRIRLEACDDNIDVIGIVSRLPDLEELEISSDARWPQYRLDEKTVYKVGSLVSKRSKKLILKCKFKFDCRKTGGTENLKLLRYVDHSENSEYLDSLPNLI